MFLFFFFKQKTEYEVRISDWSSDVCSSDLEADLFPPFRKGRQPVVEPAHVLRVMRDVQKHHGQPLPETVTAPFRTAGRLVCTLPELEDRKSVVSGKSVSVRVDLGGSRFIKTKNTYT